MPGTTCTFTNGTNIVNATAHGMLDDQALEFTNSPDGDVPAELSIHTRYYVVNKATDTFQVSLTSGGAAVTFTDDGTGTSRFHKLSYSSYTLSEVDAAVAAKSVVARQCILTAKVDSDGQPDFLSISGKTVTLDASATNLFGTWASGYNSTTNRQVDHIGSVTSDLTWLDADLTDDTTNFLYLDYNTATGAITKGTSVVRPEYGRARGGLHDLEAHTDYTSASGTVSASTEFNANYVAWKAVDQGTAASYSRWLTTSGVTTGWYHYERKSAAAGYSYSIRAVDASNHANSFPKDFTLKGSNLATPDETTPGDWTVIDTQTSQASPGQNKLLTFTPADTTPYKHILLDVTAVTGTGVYVGMEEFTLKVSQDFYSIPEGVMYDIDGTQIHRLYIGEADVDSAGDVSAVRPYAFGDEWAFWVNAGSEVSTNTLYTESNPYGHNQVAAEIFWNLEKEEDNKRLCHFNTYNQWGGTMRIASKNVLISSGAAHTMYWVPSGDDFTPTSSTAGYYLCAVKRTF